MSATVLTVVATGQLNAGITDLGAVAPDSGNGNVFLNDGKTFLYVSNASGGDLTVTFTLTGAANVLGGTTQAIVVHTGKVGIFGPFAPGIFNNSAGQVAVAWSTAASVLVKPVSVA